MSTHPSKNSSPALELIDISRRFGETQALAGASLTIRHGEIHALLGENGAGKSTLVSIAAGALRADGGQIRLAGREVRFPSPREARRSGLALVPQHDLLVEASTVAENLALLDPSAPFFEVPGRRAARVRRLAEGSALDLGSPRARVEDLPVGTRQRIEIAGALAGDPEILILDEPTAVLAPGEAAVLFASLRRRAAEGKAVVLITHRLAEVFEAADRLTLLAGGRTVKECRVAETTAKEIGSLLLGSAERTRKDEVEKDETPRDEFLISGGRVAAADRGESVSRPAAVKGALRAPRSGPGPLTAARRELSEGALPVLDLSAVVPSGSSAPAVSFSLLESEILVLLAIDGNGADTLARCVAGMHPFKGRIELLGRPLPRRGEPRAFRAAGGRFIPADRRAEGLVATLSLEENLALPSPPGRFLLDRQAMRRGALGRLSRFGIRAATPLARASALSGGNQQKLVLARELDFGNGPPALLVAIHPTRGLDLAASADVRIRIDEARRAGAAVLVVGSDPEEARPFGGTFRVVYRGALSEPLPPDTSLSALGRRMAGLAA
ncbi:MAG: ATP-binding cassette domain-containing protein [Acidithiobacillales bacterium]